MSKVAVVFIKSVRNRDPTVIYCGFSQEHDATLLVYSNNFKTHKVAKRFFIVSLLCSRRLFKMIIFKCGHSLTVAALY